ncbi:ExbD/TolR family protein [Winogradskyella sp. A2]|uniref:ExbD/TolR family protein n=1 Tax=Winogradskyella sp. A2 TaxID=3366944 RepID=UPI00398C26FE
MKTTRRQSATVNAGSMADIAFLLLIFFLVTTTISAEKGILRQLPAECPPGIICKSDIPERNLLRININAENQIMVNNEIIPIAELKQTVIDFVDNNGSNYCGYCSGLQKKESSDHPKKAVISISHDALTSYESYINVQDIITKGFYDLRSKYAKNIYNKAPEDLSKSELNSVKKAYPFIVSEVKVPRN